MEYLKQFNLTDNDIDDICNTLDDMDINELVMHEDRIIDILNYFVRVGVNNLKEVILARPDLFYENVEYIKNVIENYGTDQAVTLLNGDIANIDLINL